MIEQVKNVFSDYAMAYLVIKNKNVDTMMRIRGNYIKNSEVYNDSLKRATEEFDKNYRVLRDEFNRKIKAVFDEARSQIIKIAGKSPTSESSAVTRIIMSGALTAKEVQILLDQNKVTYGEQVMLFNMPDASKFMTIPLRVESMLDLLDDSEKKVMQCAKWYEADTDSPTPKSLIGGELLKSADNTLEEFVRRYA